MTSPQRPLVACLCASWCASCRDYRGTFEQLATRFAGEADFAWIDIEDDSDALGDPDIDDFPTLLVAAGSGFFLGPVTPHPASAERLVRAALDGDLSAPASDDDATFAERVRTLLSQRAP